MPPFWPLYTSWCRYKWSCAYAVALRGVSGAERATCGSHCRRIWYALTREHIVQVLYELVSNGFKFSAGAVQLQVSVAKGHATISVKDSGCGIPADQMAQVWGPFHQVGDGAQRGACRSGDGLGLGLYLVGAHLLFFLSECFIVPSVRVGAPFATPAAHPAIAACPSCAAVPFIRGEPGARTSESPSVQRKWCVCRSDTAGPWGCSEV